MYQLSIKISLPLYKNLKKHALENELNISDVARECLSMGIKKLSSNRPTIQEETNLQEHLIIYTLFTHCLLEKFVKNTSTNAQQLCDLAEQEAKK